MTDIINILFLGDIVGSPGRKAVCRYLANLPENVFVVANVENASHGFGLTEKNYHELVGYGINAMTSGNHIWDKKDIYTFIQNADLLIRPINYYTDTLGAGSRIFEKNGVKIGIINALGKVFMDSPISTWTLIEEQILKLREITPIVLIDFHAEATAEKIAFAKYCLRFGVSAILGTHTHVQTADEKILDNKTAYITDVGFCGAYDSVIGMREEESIERILTGQPKRFEIADGKKTQINAVSLEIDVHTGYALSIKRINFVETNCEVENK